MAGVIRAVLLLVFVAVPAFATDYTVGDTSGWTTGSDYTTWASGKTFKVGDSLVFQYGGSHDVAEVSQSDYQSCSSSNSLSSYNDGNTQIKLTAAGTRYFICGTPGHCSQGMQLAVTTVSDAASSPPSTPAPSATPGASTPTAPSTPETPTTPSTPDTTPSTPATTPSTPATTPSTPATTPTGSTPAKPSVTPSAAASNGYHGEALLLGGLLMGLGLVV